MKTALTVVGMAVIAMGLLWVGQGLGYIHWPQSSFMLDQRPWALRGGVAVVLGIILLAVARRR
jgi:hypothetical protein